MKITQILVSLSINKILLEHSHAHLFLYWPWLFSHCKLSSCLWLQSLKYTLSGPGQKMFIYTCLKHQKKAVFQRSLLFSGAISGSYFAYRNSVEVSCLGRPWVLWGCWGLFLLLLAFFFFWLILSCFYQWKKTRFLIKACSTMDNYDLFLSIILTWCPTNIYLINYGGPSLIGTMIQQSIFKELLAHLLVTLGHRNHHQRLSRCLNLKYGGLLTGGCSHFLC